MDIMNDFGVQMCLIGDENLDLTDLDFSMFETIDLDSSVYTSEPTNNFSNFSSHQSATVSLNPIEKLSNVLAFDIQPTQQVNSLLDFDLIDMNLCHLGVSTSKATPDTLFSMDILNSPSDEKTYGNVYSIEHSTEDDMTMMSSPCSSTSEDTSSEKPKMRRTRGRAIDKKESNKMAAIRYRNKKIKEKDHLFAECEEYAQKIKEMRQKVNDTQSEISFIKSLLVEALVKKSGLKI